ncbi:XRE family transcriptional regulator [Pseudomonas sp. NPDC086581]|uniref:XRE family transcriptional regulator n=1 Tax=Pseudomonas sp. NPDC086581 TaxID=3364432 RepID=UPI0038256FB5
MNTLGDRIRILRKQLDLDQKQLAALCGWNNNGQVRISSYERNRTRPSLSDLETLAAALRTTRAQLIGDDPEAEADDGARIPPLQPNGATVYISRDELAEMGLVETALRGHICDDGGMGATLPQGNRFLIDTSQTSVESNGVYAFRHDDRIVCRRLVRTLTQGWMIRCDSTEKLMFPDELISAAALENLDILGRVVWQSGRL